MANYFILEGPDGAGKTFLAQKLLEAYPGAVLRHFGAPATDKEAYDYWQTYATAIVAAKNEKTVIFDRGWYSDLVYGPVIRNRIEMTSQNIELLELLVKACGGGMVIYLTAPLQTLWARCKKRGETYIVSKVQLAEIRDKYEEVMKTAFYLPIIRTDTGSYR